jgi:hypothetical protein
VIFIVKINEKWVNREEKRSESSSEGGNLEARCPGVKNHDLNIKKEHPSPKKGGEN